MPKDADSPVVSGSGAVSGNSSMALFITLKGADEATLTSFVNETMKSKVTEKQRNRRDSGNRRN